ncbi:hypothetical protein EV05_1217 [Prochlorococcus sp. MIT 0601]|nr:hypothetical protein EV05_1217 [Prochlorococcus sp. MIT 0601]
MLGEELKLPPPMRPPGEAFEIVGIENMSNEISIIGNRTLLIRLRIN